jgi:Amt family ammonium transporter
MSPIIIGFVTGAVCFLAISLKYRFRYDDSLDVVGVHLVGGLVGSLLLGIFADKAVNSAGADGLLFGGGASLLGKQAMASFSVLAFSFVVSLALGKVIDLTIGLRVTEEDEQEGLDLSQRRDRLHPGLTRRRAGAQDSAEPSQPAHPSHPRRTSS